MIMKIPGGHNYYTYNLTNSTKKVLYTGVTNDLKRRLSEHSKDAASDKRTFTGKYNCVFLIYWERFQYIQHAIAREKEIKGWNRKKKEDLIVSFNPSWRFLNSEVE